LSALPNKRFDPTPRARYASCPFVLCKNFWYSYHMKQSLVHIALLVRDYDEAIEFYTKKLHFTVVADTYQPEQEKRWALVRGLRRA
jgi:catechol-2,3-dioxygenase